MLVPKVREMFSQYGELMEAKPSRSAAESTERSHSSGRILKRDSPKSNGSWTSRRPSEIQESEGPFSKAKPANNNGIQGSVFHAWQVEKQDLQDKMSSVYGRMEELKVAHGPDGIFKRSTRQRLAEPSRLMSTSPTGSGSWPGWREAYLISMV